METLTLTDRDALIITMMRGNDAQACTASKGVRPNPAPPAIKFPASGSPRTALARPGMSLATLALDFPNKGESTVRLLDRAQISRAVRVFPPGLNDFKGFVRPVRENSSHTQCVTGVMRY